MRKTLIVGVLSIGLLTFVSINTDARRPGDYVPYSDERVLDLSRPENLALLTTGKWEGTWQRISPSGAIPGQLLQVYSFDPKGNEEKPVVIRTKRRPAGLFGGPDKWGSARGKIEGGKVVLAGTRVNTTIKLSQRADGTLVLRSEGHGIGDLQNAEFASELYKLEDGRLSQHFPGE